MHKELLLGGLALAWSACACAFSEDESPPQELTAPPAALEAIVVTGTLIPGVQIRDSTPVVTITAADMEARGLKSVADALQQSAFATGSVQNPQFQYGYTPGLQTLSLFGLSPGYVKYLIDGRPMPDYPALYNASDVVTSLGSIPQALVDHIDVLPGGQSSLYGSDAIAGVVNVVLKRHLDGPEVNVRYGATKGGGGTSRRVSLADGFASGAFRLLAGGTFEKTDPVWGYQRPLTASYFAGGSTPITAERDYLVYDSNFDYRFLDPNNCSNVRGQFAGSGGKFTRPGQGDYCGTTRAGFNTIDNGVESEQGYLRGTVDLSNSTQLYAEALLAHDVQKFFRGADVWSTTPEYGAFYDPKVGDLINLYRNFSPEELGGLSSVMARLFSNTYQASIGLQGLLGSWRYDLEATRAQQKLVKRTNVLLNAPLNAYFDQILGPSLGTDPITGEHPIFEPDYAAFYRPLTVAQYRAASTTLSSHSQTAYNRARLTVSNAELLQLPGGSLGMAVALEAGNQQWGYVPDPEYIDGEVVGYLAVTGDGHRSFSSATAELRAPVASWLTLSASGRFDDLKVQGVHVNHPTFSAGLELRPVTALAIRARYATAFKSPSLADEFEGPSAFSIPVTDYYQCAVLGYGPAQLGNCPYSSVSVLGTTAGSPRLKPITATLWDAGIVFSPVSDLRVTVDLLHWTIRNEVQIQNPDGVAQTEALCRLGTYEIQSPTCIAALAQVTRDADGQIASINIPKVNVSREAADSVILAAGYERDFGIWGRWGIDFSWTDMVKHDYQAYPGDPVFDLLRDPTVSSDFKTKANATLSWRKGAWSSALYANRVGSSPNNVASSSGYDSPGAGRLSPWTLVNLSVSCQWTPALRTALVVDNLFDRMPPIDRSYGGTDYVPYNTFNYNVYGRSYMAQLTYRYGR